MRSGGVSRASSLSCRKARSSQRPNLQPTSRSSRVARLHARDHHMLAHVPRAPDQGVQQGPAHAAPPAVPVHVHRMLDGVAIPVPGPPVAERGVPEHRGAAVLAFLHGHEHGIPRRPSVRQPRGAARRVRDGFVPDGRGGAHRVVVDCNDSLDVACLRVAYQHRRLPCGWPASRRQRKPGGGNPPPGRMVAQSPGSRPAPTRLRAAARRGWPRCRSCPRTWTRAAACRNFPGTVP